MYNNPAFQLFLMATSEPYRLCWPTGADKMLIVSVGTGASANANADLSPEEMNLLYNAGTIPSALMAAALLRAGFSLPHFRQVPCWAICSIAKSGTCHRPGDSRTCRSSSPTPATTPNSPAKDSTRSASRRSSPRTCSRWIPSSTSAKCSRSAGRSRSKRSSRAPRGLSSLKQTITPPTHTIS